MNDAHLHLVVNHFPIIGLMFATGILFFGLFSKTNTLKNTAYVLFIIVAVFGFLSMYTGEGAEEMVEDLPTVSHNIIHNHEEHAETFVLFLYAAGLLSLIGLYLNFKKHSKANIISYAILGSALIGMYFAKEVGTTGGEIRHTEIRTDSASNSTDNATGEQQQEQEDHED